LSRRRCRGPEASQRGANLESRPLGEVSAAGVGSGTREVRGRGRRAFWADAGGRALGGRRWGAGECRDGAAGDAESGTMEPGTEAPQAARTEGAFWRTGAAGREFSCVVGRARTARLFDRHGG